MQYLFAPLVVMQLVIYVQSSFIFDNIFRLSKSDKLSCKDQLDFNSINEFRSFVHDLKIDNKEKISESCFKHREVILELEEVIETKEVCDYEKVDRIIEYHKRHFKSSRFFGITKPVTYKFFTKYAIQVAYTCKKNLILNLGEAKEELRSRGKVFEEARDAVFNEEPSIKSNIRLIEEQPDDPSSMNVKPKDKAELTLSEYREALTKLKRPEDILTFDRDDCKDSKHREILISTDKLQTFFKPAIMCHQLHRFYAGSLLSIARLANYGYMALHEDLDAQLNDNPILTDWFIAVQVCEPMLFQSTKKFQSEWAVVDTCARKSPVIEPMVFEDSIDDEFDVDMLNSMILRSEATRSHAQKLMKSALKKMAKLDIMNQLRAGAKTNSIFKKSLSIFKRPGKSLSNSNSKVSHFASKFSLQLTGLNRGINPGEPFVEQKLSDKESYELLMKGLGANGKQDDVARGNGIDSPVSAFDPLSSIASYLTLMAIMMSFEWLFFIVMTLAARISHRMFFNFENILTFPPKLLSWSDADFASLNEKLENIDEDDFFDYDELNSEEQQQRDLLGKVFGKPPPMLYKD